MAPGQSFHLSVNRPAPGTEGADLLCAAMVASRSRRLLFVFLAAFEGPALTFAGVDAGLPRSLVIVHGVLCAVACLAAPCSLGQDLLLCPSRPQLPQVLFLRCFFIPTLVFESSLAAPSQQG